MVWYCDPDCPMIIGIRQLDNMYHRQLLKHGRPVPQEMRDNKNCIHLFMQQLTDHRTYQ